MGKLKSFLREFIIVLAMVSLIAVIALLFITFLYYLNHSNATIEILDNDELIINPAKMIVFTSNQE